MAIDLEPADMIQPLGELISDLFAGQDLNALLEGWISQAVLRVEGNINISAANQLDAAKAWTYYLAYMFLADDVGSRPNSVSINNGADTVQTGQDRVSYWLGRATAKQNEYIAYVVLPIVAATNRPQPASIQTIGIW